MLWPAIAVTLEKHVCSPSVVLERPQVQVDALQRYGRTKVHFVDRVIAASAAAEKLAIASFERNFGKFANLSVDLM